MHRIEALSGGVKQAENLSIVGQNPDTFHNIYQQPKHISQCKLLRHIQALCQLPWNSDVRLAHERSSEPNAIVSLHFILFRE